MKHTFSILFYIKRSATTKSGEAPIMVRVTINGQRVCRSLHITIPQAKWNSAKERAKGASEKAIAVNTLIEGIRHSIYSCYTRLCISNIVITPKRLFDEIDGRGQSHYLLELFDEHNNDFAKMVGVCRSANTYTKYKTVYNHLCRYVRSTYDREDIPLCDIDRDFVVGFHSWLAQHAGCQTNTVWLYMIAFKHILSIAVANGELSSNVYMGYRVRREVGRRSYLTQDELVRLVQLHITRDRRRVYDVLEAFLFSCFTGLSYIDICNLSADNVECVDNQRWIVTKRAKTGAPINVQLFDVAYRILMNSISRSTSSTIFNLPSNGVCNRYIGIIMRKIGIYRRITFHSARHTFATTVMLSQGVTIEVISTLLGHRNISTSQIYTKVNRSLVGDIMKGLSTDINTIYKRGSAV